MCGSGGSPPRLHCYQLGLGLPFPILIANSHLHPHLIPSPSCLTIKEKKDVIHQQISLEPLLREHILLLHSCSLVLQKV